MVTEGAKGVEVWRKVGLEGAAACIGIGGAVAAGSRGRGCEAGGEDCCGANRTWPARGSEAHEAARRGPPSSRGGGSCARFPGAAARAWRRDGFGSTFIAVWGGAGTGQAGGGAGPSEGCDGPFFFVRTRLRMKRFPSAISASPICWSVPRIETRRVGIGPQLGAGDVMSLVKALATTANDVPDNRVGDHKRAGVAVGGVRRRRKNFSKWYGGVADGNDGRGRSRGWWTRGTCRPVNTIPKGSPIVSASSRGCSVTMLQVI
jgi:hypothetical protein